MNNSPIGFFDSGVGGLSVYSKFREILPSENTIYFGDLKNLPYGNKSKPELIGFAKNILDFFSQKEVKAVIIACNTSSALAYDTIKNDYNFKIYPIIQSCAKVISSIENIRRIGVFATEGTVNSKAYTREITKFNPNISVTEIACPNWVSIVEGENKINASKDLKPLIEAMLKNNPDKIILGCTHYPYLLDDLEKYAPQEIFLDPAEIFVNYVKNDMKNILNTQNIIGNEEFFVSANPDKFIQNAKLFYEVKTRPLVY